MASLAIRCRADNCANQNCGQGTCASYTGGFVCLCPPEYTGSHCESGPVDFTLTGDNKIVALYFDGVQVPQSSLPHADDWTQADTVLLPPTTTLIAVEIHNNIFSDAGLLASTADNSILTNSSWRCKAGLDTADNWMSPSYDDSNWSPAVASGWNEAGNKEFVAGISNSAQWIWFNGNIALEEFDTTCYCRYHIKR